MEELHGNLNLICKKVDEMFVIKKRLFNELFSKSVENLESCNMEFVLGKWLNDPKLKECIQNLHQAAELVSNTSTKVTMIITQYPSDSSILSITEEFNRTISHMFLCFTSLIQQCYIGWPLFTIIMRHIKTSLMNIQDLTFAILQKADPASIRSITGTIWKSCDDIKKIPFTNKGAYRRDIMEIVAIIKDTISEFEGYLLEYENLGNDNDINEDKDSEDIDEDDDDENYNTEDILYVNKSMYLFKLSKDAVVLGMNIITLVGDEVSKAMGSSIDDTIAVEKWIATVHIYSIKLQDIAVTDIGAELYPPLNFDVVNEKYSIGLSLLNDYLKLLNSHMGIIDVIIQSNSEIKSTINIISEKLDQLNNNN